MKRVITNSKYWFILLGLFFAGNLLFRYLGDIKIDIRSLNNQHYIQPHRVNISKLGSYVISKHDVTSRQIVTKECKAVLNCDIEEIEKFHNPMPKRFLLRDITNDYDVIEIAKNCEELRERYHFYGKNFTVTEEEFKFPIAYSILAHENSHQVLLLLSAIYREHNIHCIHLDVKASPEVYQAMVATTKCFPNVFLSTKRYNVVYAHVSRLQADIACMKDLLEIPKHFYNWKYLINLCSQDFPLRTNREIVQQLRVLKGRNNIGGYSNLNDQIRERTQFIYKLDNITQNGTTIQRIKKTKDRHSPPPYNMTVVKNLAYNLYSRDFLRWALVDSKEGPALLDWSMDTYSPDEHYWLMLNLLPGAPGGSKLTSGYQLARMIKWWFTNPPDSCHGVWRHFICIFGAEDIHELTKRRELFVNKVDVKVDNTGVKCLRQWLYERTLIPNYLRQNTNPDISPHIPPDSFFM